MKLILTEKQSKMLAQILKEENYVQPEPQNPSMKSANKPYCINPDKVLIVKRFLDRGFTPHDYEKVGADGFPVKIQIVSMNASNGEPLKYLYKSQLKDLLIDKFQKMFSDENERSLFMQQVMNDWFNGKIGVHGNLSVNRLNENSVSEKLANIHNDVNLNPTEGQKEAGNYKMGHITIKGMPISIENPKGSKRKYKNEDGTDGYNIMANHYGYFTNTTGNGKDGDAVDVFIGPYPEDFDNIFVVDQNNKEGSFDESKVMLGFKDIDDAKDAYMSNYSKGWKGLRDITGVPLEIFKKWLYRGNKQQKPFKDYVMVQKHKLDESEEPSMLDNYTNFKSNMSKREYPAFDDFRPVSHHGYMNLISTKTNDLISKEWYDWVGYMINGYAIVRKGNQYNLMNQNGKIVLPEWYDDIEDTDDGEIYTLVKNEGHQTKTFTLDINDL